MAKQRFHHCQYQVPDGQRSKQERRAAGPTSDDYVFIEVKNEVCIFCGRRRLTRQTTTVKYTPKYVEYEAQEGAGLIPTYPTDHLVIRNIDGQIIPGPGDPKPTESDAERPAVLQQ